MSLNREQILSRMTECGVVAVIRAPSKDMLPEIAAALLAGGVESIEVTMTTPDAIAGIGLLSRKLGERAIVGVGTCLDAETARAALGAGAQFVVSPAFDAEVVSATRAAEKVSIPGAFTATEILRAWNSGADVVKVFPATALGPGFFKDILAPLPFLKLTPTGGVDASNTPAWIKAGAVCVGAGSSLVSKEALAKRDWTTIVENARSFVAAVRSARR
jgi:2-dehydro-3-deoxyphosphogluconate aldolase/(4S)-4-hydroxy-2-oxoglutarate aldolase